MNIMVLSKLGTQTYVDLEYRRENKQNTLRSSLYSWEMNPFKLRHLLFGYINCTPDYGGNHILTYFNVTYQRI